MNSKMLDESRSDSADQSMVSSSDTNKLRNSVQPQENSQEVQETTAEHIMFKLLEEQGVLPEIPSGFTDHDVVASKFDEQDQQEQDGPK